MTVNYCTVPIHYIRGTGSGTVKSPCAIKAVCRRVVCDDSKLWYSDLVSGALYMPDDTSEKTVKYNSVRNDANIIVVLLAK